MNNWKEELEEKFSMDAPTKSLTKFIEILLEQVIEDIPDDTGRYYSETQDIYIYPADRLKQQLKDKWLK